MSVTERPRWFTGSNSPTPPRCPHIWISGNGKSELSWKERISQKPKGRGCASPDSKGTRQLFGGALDTATVLGGFLESAKAADARLDAGRGLAISLRGAFDTAAVLGGFLKSSGSHVLA
jgi:hypothetical protein